MWYWAIHIPVFGFLAYSLYIVTLDKVRSKFYWPFLSIKILAGISLGMVYKYYYASGDTTGFFNGGEQLAALARTNLLAYLRFLYSSDVEIIDIGYTWVPNLMMVKLTSIFNLITGDSYWLISSYFSFFCFVCLWRLFIAITNHFKNNHLAIALSFFLVPSFVFWSSGLLKESIAVGCMALAITWFVKIISIKKMNWLEVGVVVPGLILLWKLKYFYAGVLIVTLITAGLGMFIHRKRPSFEGRSMVLLTIMLFFGGLTLATLTHPNFYLSRILEVIVQNHDELILKSRSETIRYHSLEPTFFSILINAPLALFSGLFRPLLLEAKSTISLSVGIENFVLLLLAGMALWKSKASFTAKDSILLTAAVLYILVLATLLALSTPNFGTLMRFKVAFLPFLYMLALYNNHLIKGLSDKFFS